MPIFRIGEKLVHFAHVPKCAGTSVTDYMTRRFGPPAFDDSRFVSDGLDQSIASWYRSSPQHIPAIWLARLFPPGFINVSLAVVRHPVARAVSVYCFQRNAEKCIPAGMGFSAWLEDMEANPPPSPFVFDNHVSPMSEIVPDGAQIFRVEDGLARLVDWLDIEAGNCDGGREIPLMNTRQMRSAGANCEIDVSAGDRDRIGRIYAADFARFGYDLAAA